MLGLLILLVFVISNGFAQTTLTTLNDDGVTLSDEELVLPSSGGVFLPPVDHPGGVAPSHSVHKYYQSLAFFDKFHPSNWLRPLTEKINNFWSVTQHPNFGASQLWNPQFILEKLHEKGPQFLTGSQNSIYGLTHFTQHKDKEQNSLDFPFAYRRI